MSATTIGVVGAAVAGGAVAATQVAGGKDDGSQTNQPFTTFSGPFSGTVQESVTSRNNGQSCTITRSVTGTVTMKIANNDPSVVNGDMQITGTTNVTQSTCAVVNQTTPFGGAVRLSGSPSAVRGSSTNSSTGTGVGGEAITGTSTVTFEGSINGNAVTGTLTYDSQSQSNGGAGGPVDSRQTATFPVTLTKG
jgi:hypothetical protein